MRFLVVLALLSTLAACGDDDAFPDAAQHDASQIDGMVVDAAPDAPDAPQTVTIRVGKQAVAGIPVVFFDPAGTLIETVLTDAAGEATRAVPVGSSATAVIGDDGATNFQTVLGLVPGDVIELGIYPLGPQHASLGSQIFNVPVSDALKYMVCAPCSCATVGPTGLGAEVTLFEGCATATKADIIAAPINVSGQPSSYSIALDTTVGGGDPITLPGGIIGSTEFDFNLVSEAAPLVGLGQVVGTTTAMHAGHPWMSSFDSRAELQPGAFSLNTMLADTSGGIALTIHTDDFNGGHRDDLVRLAVAPATYDVDFATELLPVVGTPEATTTSLTWQIDDGLDGDGIAAIWGYDGASWSVIAPPGTRSFTIPALPAELAAMWSPPVDTALPCRVDLVKNDQRPGYDGFRRAGAPGLLEIYNAMIEPPAALAHLQLSSGEVQVATTPELRSTQPFAAR